MALKWGWKNRRRNVERWNEVLLAREARDEDTREIVEVMNPEEADRPEELGQLIHKNQIILGQAIVCEDGFKGAKGDGVFEGEYYAESSMNANHSD